MIGVSGDRERTPPEELTAQILDELGVRYCEQEPVLSFTVDFLLPDERLVVEALGDRWHRWRKIVRCDWKRYEHMTAAGYRVIGLWLDDLRRRRGSVSTLVKDVIDGKRDDYVGFAFELIDEADGGRSWKDARRLLA